MVPPLAVLAKNCEPAISEEELSLPKSAVRAELVVGLRSLKRQPMTRICGVDLGFCVCTICVFSLSKGVVEILAFASPSTSSLTVSSLESAYTASEGEGNEI